MLFITLHVFNVLNERETFVIEEMDPILLFIGGCMATLEQAQHFDFPGQNDHFSVRVECAQCALWLYWSELLRQIF